MKMKFIPLLFGSICFVLSSTISVANTITGEMIYNQIVEQLAKKNLMQTHQSVWLDIFQFAQVV